MLTMSGQRKNISTDNGLEVAPKHCNHFSHGLHVYRLRNWQIMWQETKMMITSSWYHNKVWHIGFISFVGCYWYATNIGYIKIWLFAYECEGSNPMLRYDSQTMKMSNLSRTNNIQIPRWYLYTAVLCMLCDGQIICFIWMHF